MAFSQMATRSAGTLGLSWCTLFGGPSMTHCKTVRWETLVPIARDKDSVIYRYKFDFEYQGFPARQPDSKLSKGYQLFILEK